jgi:hypothetical protein
LRDTWEDPRPASAAASFNRRRKRAATILHPAQAGYARFAFLKVGLVSRAYYRTGAEARTAIFTRYPLPAEVRPRHKAYWRFATGRASSVVLTSAHQAT